MGSVKEVKVLKSAEKDKEGEGEFIFSDRYSVFDWGEMPDHIDKKGAALCVLSAFFFDILDKKGVRTHFLGLVEDGKAKKFAELKSYSNKMRVKLVRVLKPAYDSQKNSYDYSVYNGEKDNYLIPLEVIYRNKLGDGSSVFKRLKSGAITYKDMGLDHEPKPGEVLVEPIIDVSTKLEHIDRYLGWEEAAAISGLSPEGIKKVKDLTLLINGVISEYTKKYGIENEDGKFEFAIDREENTMLIDVLGTPDECRFSYKGFHISKEFARRWYRKTEWFNEVEKAKKERGRDWKKFVKIKPEPLPDEMKILLSHMYLAVTNEITGRRFFDVPELPKIIEELKKYDT